LRKVFNNDGTNAYQFCALPQSFPQILVLHNRGKTELILASFKCW